MSVPHPPAMLSIDLDDYWTYLRSFGRDGWQSRPSFLSTALPRVQSLLAECGLDITVFVVGVDAHRDINRDALCALAADGHEFGNHSWEHDAAVFAGAAQDIERDVTRADAAIASLTGLRPRGFRGPSYATSNALLQALCAHGYSYDASNFPMSLSALVTLYQRTRSRGAVPVPTARSSLRDTIRQTWGSLHPHRIHDGKLAEFPVTTLPLLRFPVHFTYLHALGDCSPRLARRYLQLALKLCAARRIPPSLLLHASDFMGADDPFDMHFLPGMRRTWADKQRLLYTLLDDYRARFRVTGIGRYLQRHPLPRTS